MNNVSPADASPAAPADSSLTTEWPAPIESQGSGPAVGSNLDTIRHILFGARSRDRISTLAASLTECATAENQRAGARRGEIRVWVGPSGAGTIGHR